MLNFVRTHQRWMQLILFVFIVPSFVLIGIDSYSKFLDQPDDLVKIDKETITMTEFKEAFKDFTEQEKNKSENQNDETLINTATNRQLVLDEMIHSRVSKQEAIALQVQTSDDKVLKYIAEMPFVAQLKKPDGSIDLVKLNQSIIAQGMTPEQFQERIRYLITLEYLPQNISPSTFLPENIKALLAEKLAQKRWIQGINFNYQKHLANAEKTTTEDELKNYFTKHATKFLSPEQVNIDYVILDKTKINANTNFSDEQLKTYYQKNNSEFKISEQRGASHILFKVEKTEEKATQKAKAESLLKEFISKKISIEAFQKSAKINSQDPGSKDKGGELGLFSRGTMLKPFDEAAFGTTTIGLIPKIIETDFGFHILYIQQVKPTYVLAFEEAKSAIVEKLTQQAQTDAFNQQLKIADAGILDNLELSKLAAKLGVNVQSAKGVYKKLAQQPKTQAQAEELTKAGAHLPEIIKNPKVITTLFNPEILNGKRLTDVIGLGNQSIIAHVSTYTKEKPQSFEQARADVKQILVKQKAIKLARQEGIAKLAQAKLGETLVWSNEQEVSRMLGNIPKDISEAIFNTDGSKLPNYSGVNTEYGYMAFKINKIEDVKDLKSVKEILDAFSGVYSLEESRAVLEDLKTKHHVRMIKPLSEVK